MAQKLFAPQGSAMAKALREVGCSAPIFGVHNVEDPSEVAAAQGTYDGIWYATGDDRAGRFYFDAYRKKYHSYPAMGGANAFDYAKMIIEAAQQSKPLLAHLKGLKDFEGAFGKYGAAPGNTFELRATLRAIRDGKFVDLLPN
jgi:ABC-type branched-subunit amino acid transport system substrate-binding protein